MELIGKVSKELYRPPGARGTSAILKFLEEREAPSNPKAPKPVPGANIKPKSNNKKQERKAKKAQTATDQVVETRDFKDIHYVSTIELQLTGDETVDKKLKDLKKVSIIFTI